MLWQLRRLGREVRGLSEGDWRRRAPNVVYKGNRAKFLQNEGARRELFESRGKVLVEASRGDRFWGIGLGMGDREIQVNGRLAIWDSKEGVSPNPGKVKEVRVANTEE